MMTTWPILIVSLIVIVGFGPSNSANILVVAPFFGRSHSIFVHPIVRALAAKGHDLTVITSNPIKDPPKNVKQVHPNYEDHPIQMDPKKLYELDSMPVLAQAWFVWKLMVDGTERTLNTSNVKKFINDDNSNYDLVLMEQFFHEAFYALAHKYDAPIVLLGASGYWSVMDPVMGNPPTMPFVGYEFGRVFSELTLLQRTTNYLVSWFCELYRLIYLPKHDGMIEKYFTAMKSPKPTVRELESRIAMLLLNSHFSMDTARPLVPGVVEIAGVHLDPPKKLPEDLQTFLDGAKDGFIYFSLGSNLRSSALPKEKIEGIVKALSKLKQRVLWKWEDDNLPQLPSNVKMAKWLPQLDVLSHPNIKLFITQAGMLSIQEAISRGVPLIAIPVFGDQHMNIAKLEHIGMGISLSFPSLSEHTLSEAIGKIIDDPKYANAAKRVAARFNDRPLSPRDTAVYWIEYVLKHRGDGESVMKSRLIELHWYQRWMIDVYLFMFAVVYVALFFAKRVFRGIARMFGKSDTKYAMYKKHT